MHRFIDGTAQPAQRTFRIVVYRALPGVVNDFRNLDSFAAQEKVFTINKENEMTVEKFNALLELI